MKQTGISRWDKRIITQELNNEWIKNTKYILENIDKYEGKEYKIPPIVHSVFFTKSFEHIKLKDLYITKSSICIEELNKVDSGFKHYIWTNNLNIDIGKLSEFSNVEIKLITEFSNHPLYDNIFKLLTKNQLKTIDLVQASDVARIMVTQIYGGIYHDLDYEIFDAPLIIKYMKSFNYFNSKEFDFHDSFIGNAFFACSMNHPIINETISLILRNLNSNDDAPEYIIFPETPGDRVIMETGPLPTTIACCKAMNKEGNIDVIFPAAVFYNAKQVNQAIKLPVNNEFYGIFLKTVGADMFSGVWSEDEMPNALKSNLYNKNNHFIGSANLTEIIKTYIDFHLSSIWLLIDVAYRGINKIFFNSNINTDSKDLEEINKKIDKIYVINLENAHERWSKVSKSLDKLNIPYERFEAINAINIKVVEQKTGTEFTGKELKNNLALLKYDHKYTIICNPNDPTSFIFNFQHIKVDYKYGVEYLGIMCSNFIIASEIVKNKYKNAIIFEDDIQVEATNFQTKLVNYISHLPETFDLAYLGVYSDKSQQNQINEYVNSFAPEANFFCRMGLIESYKGAEKLLLNELYWGSLDHYIRANAVYTKIPNTDQFILETYVSIELQDAIYISPNSLYEV